MKNISNFIQYYILLDIIINNLIQQQNCYEFKIQAKKGDLTLDHLNIIDYSNEKCNVLIPSLFYPILIHSNEYEGGKLIVDESINLNIPMLEEELYQTAKYYWNTDKFLNYFEFYFAKYNKDNICYFGLSMNYPNNTSGLEENQVLLSWLKDKGQIPNKIFSFDKFNLNENSLDTTFYFGEVHNKFTSNEGIIGTCKINEEDIFWGCSFNEMIINDIAIPLKRAKDNKLYKIYLTTENYDLTLPRELINEKDLTENVFKNNCKYDVIDKDFKCHDIFKDKDYIPLKLMSEDINITLELDKFNKYFSNNNNNNNEEIIKINFKNDNNYIIFPLILFKQFHVQFDAEKKVINFYTTDSSILQVKEKKKEIPKNDEEDSSSSLTVFLVILIILLVIGIGLGVFYFLRLRKNKVEKDINRFTKFEDEEDFKNMNENKVY